MKTQVRKFTQIAIMLFIFTMMLPNVKAQTIGSQIRIGADSTISYWNGSAWIAVPPGLPGQSLQFTNGIPAWIDFPVTDYDGNAYDVITIGTQRWLKQNLKTTHYKNGNPITYPGTDNSAWNWNTDGDYAWYNNDEVTYKEPYGALYNWYAVNTGNLCPTGWHVPSDAEWTTLTDYLGGANVAGGKLKEAGLSHWTSPNTAATNETGFTALPGGIRYIDGIYYYIGERVYWWSSTLSSTNYANLRTILNYQNDFYNYDVSLKTYGQSVRCLRD